MSNVDNELNPVIGIDLGTTFTAIARWHENRREPRHYQYSQGGDELQSVVYCDPDNQEILVGKLAYRKGLIHPENVAIGIKRKMDDASQKISIGGREFSPIELSAQILSAFYQNIEQQYGAPGNWNSRGTVVTVPYYFKAHQCEHTRKAADLANINCIGLIQEPIAASLAYAWQTVQEHPKREGAENILIFDLGGGTFDLTLFQLEQTQEKLIFEVLATGGDDRLGGMDFDECLFQLLLEKGGLTLDGLSPFEQLQSRQKLLEAAIEAKITLSAATETYVSVPDVIPGKYIDTKLTRSEFETSIQRYIDKIDSIIEKLWATANLERSQVDRVILVGGSSKVPRMKSLVCDLIGEDKVYGNTKASLCVAEGAAMYAAYLDDPNVFGRNIEVKTRTCHALGVETKDGEFHEVIPRNRKTPCEKSCIYSTSTDNMTSLDINVYQGSSRLVKDNSLIGTVNISDLAERPAGELNIEVIFKLDSESNLSVIVEVDGRRWVSSFKFT